MATPLAHLEGKYEVLARLSEGGMGALYKVRHRLLDEVRCVKVVRPQLKQDERIRARFLREARVAARLHHPAIAQLYDFAIDDDGNAYLVMEYIDGIALDELMAQCGRVPVGFVVDLARQALDALGHLHRRGIVHRDISPDNLMVARDDDGRPQVKLIDLGLAKSLVGDSRLTTAGTFLGKVRYASPEQFRGGVSDAPDARSDLYSLGVVLYEMLTGTLPFPGDAIATLIAGHLLSAALPFATSDPDGRVPEALRAAVLRALEKAPDARFQTAAEFAAELEPIASAHPVPPDACETLLPQTVRITLGSGASDAQHLLDRQFAKVTTPPPPTSAREPTLDPGAYRAAVEALCASGEFQEALELLARNHPGVDADWLQAIMGVARAGAQRDQERVRREVELAAARARIENLLGSSGAEAAAAELGRVHQQFGSDPGLVELSERITAALARRRATELRRMAAGAEKLVREGRLDEASALLLEALDRFGEAEELDRVGEALEAEREARRTAEAAEALQRAEAALASDRPSEAVRQAERALELVPGWPDASRTLAAARTATERSEERRRRSAEVARVALSVRHKVEEGHLEQAEKALAAARVAYGDDDGLAPAAAAVAEALARRAEAERRVRQGDAARLLARARALQSSGLRRDAVVTLRQACELDPGLGEAVELLAVLRDSELAFESRRIDAFIDRGQVEAAETCLRKAIATLGEDEVLADLRRRIDALRADLQG